jgi:flagellum-specific peptidoglycan hydrolase FlgJ
MSWTGSRSQFINEFGPYIHKVTKGTGILPGTLIAQAFLESSTRALVGGSTLSREANNFFGIKCGPSWNGETYYINTREVLNGKNVTVNACFRKYTSVENSIKDYVNFLQVNPRYAAAGVFEAKTVKEQAEALKAAGYATAPGYAKLVNDVYRPYAELIESKRNMAGIDWKTTIAFVLLAGGLTILYNKFKQ